MFKKILIPIDVDELAFSEPGVIFAAELAALAGGAIRMIYVLPEFPNSFQELLPARVRTERESAIISLFQDMAKKARIPPESLSHIIRIGPAYHEVLAEAEEWAADLIVVGSHNPSMRTYLLGSNAQKIVRHANCSVFVVRPHRSQRGTYRLLPEIAS
jgi:nucleotide-binding universal stress UspA family protein